MRLSHGFNPHSCLYVCTCAWADAVCLCLRSRLFVCVCAVAGCVFARRLVARCQGLPYMAVSPGNFMATHGGLSSKFVAACEGRSEGS